MKLNLPDADLISRIDSLFAQLFAPNQALPTLVSEAALLAAEYLRTSPLDRKSFSGRYLFTMLGRLQLRLYERFQNVPDQQSILWPFIRQVRILLLKVHVFGERGSTAIVAFLERSELTVSAVTADLANDLDFEALRAGFLIDYSDPMTCAYVLRELEHLSRQP